MRESTWNRLIRMNSFPRREDPVTVLLEGHTERSEIGAQVRPARARKIAGDLGRQGQHPLRLPGKQTVVSLQQPTGFRRIVSLEVNRAAGKIACPTMVMLYPS